MVMTIPMAAPGSVRVCSRRLSAATVLSACMLVLGKVGVADQPAKTDNPSPTLRWRVATSPGGDYVLALAVDQNGLISSDPGLAPAWMCSGRMARFRRKLNVGKGTQALAVAKDGRHIRRNRQLHSRRVRSRRHADIELRRAQIGCAWRSDCSSRRRRQRCGIRCGRERRVSVNPDGAVRWQSTTLAPVDALTLGSNGIVYAGAGDTVYALGPDGILKSKFGVGTRPGIVAGIGVVALAVGRGDMLYVGTRDRIVYVARRSRRRCEMDVQAARDAVFASRGARRSHLCRLLRRQHLFPRSYRREASLDILGRKRALG